MVASALTGSGFLFGLRVSHSAINPLKNISFREASVFQASDLRTAKNGLALQSPLKNRLDDGIRQAHQLERNRFTTQHIQLIEARYFENLGFRKTGARHIAGGVRAIERMFLFMGRCNQSDASVIANSSIFELYDLRYF
jgi:hypothetical protein